MLKLKRHDRNFFAPRFKIACFSFSRVPVVPITSAADFTAASQNSFSARCATEINQAHPHSPRDRSPRSDFATISAFSLRRARIACPMRPAARHATKLSSPSSTCRRCSAVFQRKGQNSAARDGCNYKRHYSRSNLSGLRKRA